MQLSVGEILSGTFAMIKARFWPMAGMWAMFFGLTIMAMLVFLAAIGMGSMSSLAQGNADILGTLGVGFIVAAVVFYVALFALTLSQMGALTAKASPLQDLSFGEAMVAGFRSSPTMLAVMILMLIGYFVGALILALPWALLASAGTAGGLIMLLIVVPLVIFLACRLSLLLPVAAVEQMRNPFMVIGRSWSLTKGKVLPIFLSLVVFMLAIIALGALLFVPVWGALTDAANPPGGMLLAYMLFAYFAFLIIASVAQAAVVSVIHGQVSGSVGVDLEDTFG